MELKDRIAHIYIALANLNNELEEIRQKCPHPETRIGLYSYRVGAIHPQRLCTVCDRPLGEPITTEEKKQADELLNPRYIMAN